MLLVDLGQPGRLGVSLCFRTFRFDGDGLVASLGSRERGGRVRGVCACRLELGRIVAQRLDLLAQVLDATGRSRQLLAFGLELCGIGGATSQAAFERGALLRGVARLGDAAREIVELAVAGWTIERADRGVVGALRLLAPRRSRLVELPLGPGRLECGVGLLRSALRGLERGSGRLLFGL